MMTNKFNLIYFFFMHSQYCLAKDNEFIIILLEYDLSAFILES